MKQPTDPGEGWTDEFAITALDRQLIDEFRRRPIGQHPPALQRILIKMRGAPLAGKHVLFCRHHHKEWVLAEMTGDRTRPVRLIEDRVFSSREEAEWEVFKLRWKAYTNEDLE
jgi:hypothetical protein